VFYLQTIPQLYGKVNHTTNHLIVFGAILALAPCCDALSIDAIRSAIRRAARGEIRRSPVSRAYGFPVKAMMLMVGVAYFFPGVWKVSVAWGQWFTATNLSRLIITMLHDQPPSAFQSWMLGMPTLLFLGSVATIVFEVGFVFAILVRRLRPIAALAGLAFHNAIGLLMAIPFGSLQVCYVIFIDWRAIGARIADRRHIGPLTVVYDASCVLCRRAVGILVAFDWLDLLRPVPNTTLDRLSPVERSAIASIDPTTTFLAIDGAQVVTAGYEAYGAIARRLVLLWPMLPALASARVRRHGQRVYARVAASRACRVQDRTTPRRETVARPSIPMSLRVTCIGVLAGMCLAGAGHLVAGWPLACYPPFDKPVGPVTTEVELEATDVDGRVEDWVPSFDDPIRDRLSRERWIGLLSPFLITDRPFPEARARALIAVWQQEHAIPPIVSVRFYADSYTIAVGPERWARVQRREIGAVSVAGGTSAMRTQPARDVVARAPVNLGQSPDAG
jgi:predicted DCC family thiol-disulfide oxidoreductase YuxK